MDRLADELACVLLGEGFGNGVGALYGAFRADLVSGAIDDEENVGTPEEGRF